MPNDLSQPTPQPLSVSLVMTPTMYTSLQREQGALTIAQAYEIDSASMAVEANTELQSVKGRIKQVKEWKSGFVAPAKQIIANAESLFDPALESLAQAEATLKAGLMTWQTAETKRIEDARRAQEEADRRARQKAEQEAAAIKAKADADAAEARRKAEEALQAQLKAVAEGDASAARAAAAEAAKQSEKAAAAIENGEMKSIQTEMAAAARVTAPVETAPAKLAGFSTRDNWVVELAAPTEADAIKAIGAALATRPELIAMLKLDMPAAGKLAKALKHQFNVPGLKAVNKPVAASRG